MGEPAQEPVAWRWENAGEDKWLNKYIYLDNGAPDYPEECEPLYTTPPQREWVGLTDDEVNYCIKFPNRNLFARDGTTSQRIARAIEAKLKEKNNGT